MSLLKLFEWIQELPSSVALRESLYGYSVLLTAHVVGMCLFLGLIVMMDLRLAGIGNRGTSVTQIQKRLFPWQMIGLAISAITGLLLLYSQPMLYYGKVFFWAKLLLMVFACVNAAAFHLGTYRSVAEWDGSVTTPFGAKLAGVLSLALWTGVVLFGRLTAYHWLTYE